MTFARHSDGDSQAAHSSTNYNNFFLHVSESIGELADWRIIELKNPSIRQFVNP
jgi:hypothetical protein